MFPFSDYLLFDEIMSPGGVLGSTEMPCPYCGTRLAMEVENPDGTERYQCEHCSQEFVVDWANERVYYNSEK